MSTSTANSLQHLYPSSMKNLPTVDTSNQLKHLQDLKREHSEWVAQLEDLKKMKNKLIQKRVTLNVMNKLLQPNHDKFKNTVQHSIVNLIKEKQTTQNTGSTSKKDKNKKEIVVGQGTLVLDPSMNLTPATSLFTSDSLSHSTDDITSTVASNSSSSVNQQNLFSTSQQHEQLFVILQQDRDEVLKEQKELQERYDQMMKEVVTLKSKVRKHEVAANELHDLMELLFIHNHPIDDLHLRFDKVAANSKILTMNIGCSHEELFRGLMHIFEDCIAFESIVLRDFKPANSKNTVAKPKESSPKEKEAVAPQEGKKEQNKEEENRSKLYIFANQITSLVKQEATNSILIKTTDNTKYEFFDFKDIDTTFEQLFQLKSNKK